MLDNSGKTNDIQKFIKPWSLLGYAIAAPFLLYFGAAVLVDEILKAKAEQNQRERENG